LPFNASVLTIFSENILYLNFENGNFKRAVILIILEVLKFRKFIDSILTELYIYIISFLTGNQ